MPRQSIAAHHCRHDCQHWLISAAALCAFMRTSLQYAVSDRILHSLPDLLLSALRVSPERAFELTAPVRKACAPAKRADRLQDVQVFIRDFCAVCVTADFTPGPEQRRSTGRAPVQTRMHRNAGSARTRTRPGSSTSKYSGRCVWAVARGSLGSAHLCAWLRAFAAHVSADRTVTMCRSARPTRAI